MYACTFKYGTLIFVWKITYYCNIYNKHGILSLPFAECLLLKFKQRLTVCWHGLMYFMRYRYTIKLLFIWNLNRSRVQTGLFANTYFLSCEHQLIFDFCLVVMSNMCCFMSRMWYDTTYINWYTRYWKYNRRRRFLRDITIKFFTFKVPAHGV